jgi:hypothetical protein
VNLPSLRREHAGNDPTITLVGATGSSGWTKTQHEEEAVVPAASTFPESTGMQPLLVCPRLPSPTTLSAGDVDKQRAFETPDNNTHPQHSVQSSSFLIIIKAIIFVKLKLVTLNGLGGTLQLRS